MSLAGPAADVAAWTIVDAVQDVTDRLIAVGLRAVWDLDDVNPPGLYLQLPTVRWQFARGTFEADHTLYLIAANTKRGPAIRELADLLVQVQDALGNVVVTGRPVDVTAPDGTRQLAAYELTWTDRSKRRPPPERN